ncbi:MAG: molecular chaperone DnaJ [Flavobacterium sp.]|nr:MAG: molecular chaperone DnaJ [Flavobacterium sp.]
MPILEDILINSFIALKITPEQTYHAQKYLEGHFYNSVIFWLAVTEGLIIIILLIKLYKKKSTNDLSDIQPSAVRKARQSNIDMDNVINSINGSRALYKELSRKCHPDLFIDSPNQDIAEAIFQEITKNQRNFEKLSALKVRAVNELNINF